MKVLPTIGAMAPDFTLPRDGDGRVDTPTAPGRRRPSRCSHLILRRPARPSSGRPPIRWGHRAKYDPSIALLSDETHRMLEAHGM